LSPRLWSIDGIGANFGEVNASPNASPNDALALAAPVFKLNKLGFFLGLNGGGLINEGDEGSDVCDGSTVALKPPKLRARLFGFLNFLGEGEVIGRSVPVGGRTGFRPATFRLWKASKPNGPPVKDDSGTTVTGDSGDEDGEGSDNEEESIVDIVVVGEESVESEAWVDVLWQW
jgi:hypothetical protein